MRGGDKAAGQTPQVLTSTSADLVKDEDLSLDADTITPDEIKENPSLAIDEAVKVITAAVDTPKFGKVTQYISNLFERVRQTMSLEAKLNSMDVFLSITSPAKMECVLTAFAAADVDKQSFVDVLLQYFKVLQMGTTLETRNVAWTRELKAAVDACVTEMNESFLPAFVAAATLCSLDTDTGYIVRLDAANKSFLKALRRVEFAMKEAAVKAVPVPLQKRIMHMAWNVMWYLFLASLLTMLVAFVIFYAQLQFNQFTPIYRRLGDEHVWLSKLKRLNVPEPIVNFIKTVLETNSAPAFWADVQRNVADSSSWWHTGTLVLGQRWLTLLNAVFNPMGSVFSFVSKWTRMVRWTNLLVSFSSTLSTYIVDPLFAYIAPSSLNWIVSGFGLTSIAVYSLLSWFVSYQNIWQMAKLVFSLGKYTLSLVTTTRTITLGYTCDPNVHACVPFTNKDVATKGQVVHMTLDDCTQTC